MFRPEKIPDLSAFCADHSFRFVWQSLQYRQPKWPIYTMLSNIRNFINFYQKLVTHRCANSSLKLSAFTNQNCNKLSEQKALRSGIFSGLNIKNLGYGQKRQNFNGNNLPCVRTSHRKVEKVKAVHLCSYQVPWQFFFVLKVSE